jgi:hypothetical protein
MPDTNRLAALVLIFIALVLAYVPLNNEVKAIASAEGATAIEQTAGLLLPYVMIFMLFILGAAMVYEALKK